MIRLVPVDPIGTRSVTGFAMREHGCGLETFDVPAYSPEVRQAGRVLGVHRVEACDLTLGEAARATGLTVEQVSGIERGRYVFVGESDRVAYVAALEAAARERSAGHIEA